MADPHCGGWSVPQAEVPSLVADWLGPRNWRATGTLPVGRRVAVVSSRHPRLIDPCGVWLQAMRAALDRLREPHTVVLIAAGTAGSQFVLRGAERQHTPRMVIWCPGQSVQRTTTATHGTVERHIDLWPDPLSADEGSHPLGGTPARDRVAIAWPDEIIVLALRTGGNLHRLLRERLRYPNASVLLANEPGIQSRRARDELIALGAKSWPFKTPTGAELVPAVEHKPDMNLNMPATARGITPCPPTSSWDYLTHSTRSCPGPWPGQSSEDYMDSLLDGRNDGDHSALGSLMRIVIGRRLIASSRAIRGGFSVVSFTEVPLAELPRLRVFRAHRARWDFEPYGICVRRERLIEFGARPVVYGVDSDWNRSSDTDRPFFQQVRPKGMSGASSHDSIGIDWSVEREWRHSGDLDLTLLSREDAILFVPTVAQARKLLEISPWPVTVLESSLT